MEEVGGLAAVLANPARLQDVAAKLCPPVGGSGGPPGLTANAVSDALAAWPGAHGPRRHALAPTHECPCTAPVSFVGNALKRHIIVIHKNELLGATDAALLLLLLLLPLRLR